MALSSQTASSSLPLSSASQWKNDVFLSFRGADTRRGIVSFLYHELQNRGIQTFMDDQGLQQGMPIAPSLLAAIEESRCAIVLLSPNYASSTWCLDELEKILQCFEAKKTKVLPIFYEVDPSDVRNQRGSFAEAFTKHEERYRHNNAYVEKEKKWRAALTKVANLSGLDSKKYESDRELVQCIVELVCGDLRPVSIISNDGFVAFEATRRAMDELMTALKNSEVAAIGVYGMGGVGKTTMVKHLSALAQQKGVFDHVVMAVVSQTPNTRNIQGALADLLGLKLGEETEIGRAARLQTEILRRSKILIILDDIWNGLDLSSIGIPSYNELRICNSKLLLTTRRMNVCCTMKSQHNIHLNVLSEQDAWDLFLKEARKSYKKSTKFHEVARKVTRECAGLPIALIVVGRALRDKDLEDWKEAARRLEMSQPANLDEEKDVFNCIKLSYDYLDSDDAKSCFLLCCLFPEDYDIPIEDLMKYGLGTGLFRDVNSTIENARVTAKSVTKYLKASCLLLESAKEGCVKMHDVIRDMAISIERPSYGPAYLMKTHCDFKDWSINAHEDYSAISLMGSNICKLPNKLVCPKLQILLLQENADIRKIPKEFFQSPNDLRVLDLRRMSISSLPQSFSLLTRLQVLHLDYCGYGIDFSIIGKLKYLEILSMKRCYRLKKFPKEIGNLTNLKMLDITHTSCKTFPSQVISRLSRLEELYMAGSFEDWGKFKWLPLLHKNAGFDELTSLLRLTTLEVNISGVECLPQNVKFTPNWVNFCICIGSFGWYLPKKQPGNSSRGVITKTSLKHLPDWFISVVTEKTEELQCCYCYGLTNLVEEHDRARLHGLKYLWINHLYAEVLLNTYAWPRVLNEPLFVNLEELKITWVHDLEELCVGELPPGSLQNLKIFNVYDCDKFVKPLLSSRLLKRLQSLEKLDCSRNKEMKYVFGFERDEAQHIVLTKLRVISLRHLGSLKSIWNGPAPPQIFQGLKICYLDDCPVLDKYLFTSDVAQCMLQLEALWVEDCCRLDRIIEASEETESNKIILPQLKNLVLKNLPELTRLSGTSSSTIDVEIGCPSLEQLYVDHCPRFSISASGINNSNQVESMGFGWFSMTRGITDSLGTVELPVKVPVSQGESKLSHFPLGSWQVKDNRN